MKLARSTYYYRARRAAAREMALHERIINLCEEFPRYGYRRVTQQLRAEGVLINHKKVTRIMQEHSLQVRPLRRFVRTTDSDHANPIFPNLAAAFSPTGPNELWVADLTYVAIAVRFVFVAVILDAWSRRVGRLCNFAPSRYACNLGRSAHCSCRTPAATRMYSPLGPRWPVRC
jgi:putative transposase